MKRLLSLFLFAALVLLCVSAQAAPIKVEGLTELKLYDLYSQVQSQLLLNKLEDVDAYSDTFDYDDIERNPGKHTGDKILLDGTILQVVEDTAITTYRISVGKKGSDVFLITYTRPADSERFLEDDSVRVYAEFVDLTTYSSTTNLSVTVPYCKASLMIRSITNKNVTAASNEELEEALEAIRTRLTKAIAKDQGYSKVTKTNYDDFARHESLHKDEQITISGKVLQVVEGTYRNTVRLAVDSVSDKVFYLTVDKDLSDIRVLEDDSITVRGKYSGLYTYSSTMGGEITIPSAAIEKVTVKGYKIPQKFPKDKDGNVKLTKALFEDYSRRPNEHLNEKITFSAKVLQVIEGDEVSEYRMAVDSNSNSVIYVQLPNSDRVMRVLENDKVTVVATFDGLLTYQSTMGVAITIPQCTAASVVIPGKAATVATKNANGFYQVTKKNYESFARDEKTYLDKPVTFTAEVAQVVESGSVTIYRLAVDKDYDSMFLGTIDNSNLSIRILEDDVITVEGTSTGLYSYNSTRGGKITIPSCEITQYTVNGYVKQEIGSPDKDGYYKITKKTYDELARNPKPYESENITFKAKVIQVVERSGGNNIYRVAVDSDSNCVFYVEYDLPAGASRILEKDIVTLKGEYYGIYSYTTTLGSTVSVPALIASEMKK